jgi:hypothetical protein
VPELPSEADIRCPAGQIFDLIIDFKGQDRWLAKSSAFRGTSEISSDPVTLGTTYREPGPFGVRNGTVAEFERPSKITFHQPMTLRLHAGVVDVTLRYTLTPHGESTHVTRVVTIDVPRSLWLIRPTLVRAFRAESGRTLIALKAYADQLPPGLRGIDGVAAGSFGDCGSLLPLWRLSQIRFWCFSWPGQGAAAPAGLRATLLVLTASIGTRVSSPARGVTW